MMNKFKKILTSISLFFLGIMSKVFAVDIDPRMIEDKYGVFEPRMITTKYGVFEPTIGEKISRVGKIAIPIVLFVIGLFVILSKKTNKKIKIIVISGLIVLGVIMWNIMKYIATNY